MVIALIIIATVLGMKINGMMDAPWWVVVVFCIFTLIVGALISGRLRVKFEENEARKNEKETAARKQALLEALSNKNLG